jgi:hypothetical protein
MCEPADNQKSSLPAGIGFEKIAMTTGDQCHARPLSACEKHRMKVDVHASQLRDTGFCVKHFQRFCRSVERS